MCLFIYGNIVMNLSINSEIKCFVCGQAVESLPLF